jgi:tetratricopeptide (TPR) repeat protein
MESERPLSRVRAYVLFHALKEDRRPLPELVEAYRVLGFLQGKEGQRAPERESARRAVAVAESLLARERSAAHGAVLATALYFLGSVVTEPEEKLSIYRCIAALGESLLAEAPRDQRSQCLAMIVGGTIQVGFWECQCGRPHEAIKALLEARDWGAKLLPEIGPKAWGCFDLADIEYHLGRAYREARLFDEAIAAGRRAIAIHRTLASEYPRELRPANGLKEAEQEIARAYLAAGRRAEAIDAFDRARRTLESVVAHPNLLPAMVVENQLALADLDQMLRALSDPEPARYARLRRAATNQVFEIFSKLNLIQPLSPHARGLFADACLGMALYREQDTGQADLDLLRKAEGLWAKIHREEPARSDVRGYLVIARQQLAEETAVRGLEAEASRWRRESLGPARGDADLLHEIALEYARYALEVGGVSPQRVLPRRNPSGVGSCNTPSRWSGMRLPMASRMPHASATNPSWRRSIPCPNSRPSSATWSSPPIRSHRLGPDGIDRIDRRIHYI